MNEIWKPFNHNRKQRKKDNERLNPKSQINCSKTTKKRQKKKHKKKTTKSL